MFLVRENGPGGADGTPGRGDRRPPGKSPGKPATGLLLTELQGCLGDHFAVEHCTFQLEPAGHSEREAGLCH